MRQVRIVRVVAALVLLGVGLLGAACSGSSVVDLESPGVGSSSGAAPITGSDAQTGGSSGGVTPPGQPPPGQTHDASAAGDAETQADGAPVDATIDASAPDGDAPPDAPPPSEAGPPGPDAGSPDAGGFACGPALRCDPATEYCNIGPSLIAVTQNIVVPLDGGASRYSCLALPACDASDVCLCIQGGGGILTPASANIVPGGQCSCNDSNGNITRTCTGGPVPVN
jgi:hypothetical protein